MTVIGNITKLKKQTISPSFMRYPSLIICINVWTFSSQSLVDVYKYEVRFIYNIYTFFFFCTQRKVPGI